MKSFTYSARGSMGCGLNVDGLRKQIFVFTVKARTRKAAIKAAIALVTTAVGRQTFNLSEVK